MPRIKPHGAKKKLIEIELATTGVKEKKTKVELRWNVSSCAAVAVRFFTISRLVHIVNNKDIARICCFMPRNETQSTKSRHNFFYGIDWLNGRSMIWEN